MRRTLVAGNWKMFGSRALLAEVIGALRDVAGEASKVAEVALCPPFPLLAPAAELLAGSGIGLGAQNLHAAAQGAHTGEVSGAMLREAGCRYVIVGHSERRRDCAESDALVAEKAAAALREGLCPIVCVGEDAGERAAGRQFAVVERQLAAVGERLGAEGLAACVLAYEPVWAIGTGHTATPAQAQEIHAFLRARLGERDATMAAGVRILYGGSVKADNARELFAQPDIDGALVGGASLSGHDFAAICTAAEGKRWNN